MRDNRHKPLLVIASTSYLAEETYVFESSDKLGIVSYDDFGGLALRWGNDNWTDPEAAVKSCFPNDDYKMLSSWGTPNGKQYLFALVPPDEFTYWDGDESDRIVY